MTSTSINTTLGDFCPKNVFAVHPDNPLKESEFNWLFKNRDANGFKDAFVKVTVRNFLVHIPTFAQCLTDRRDVLEATRSESTPSRNGVVAGTKKAENF